MPTEDQIATAVNGYCKSLRYLGRDKTSIGEIADSLHLQIEEVENAFKTHKIIRAKVADNLRVTHTMTKVVVTPVIHLARI